MASGVIKQPDIRSVLNGCGMYSFDISGTGTVRYISHLDFAILTSDRGGLWVQGINSRGLYQLQSTDALTVIQDPTNVMKVTSNIQYSTVLWVLSKGFVWMTTSV